MIFDGMSISELTSACKNTRGGMKRISLKDVSKYLYHRIRDEDWCSEKEIRDLDFFVSEITMVFWDIQDKGQLKKVLKRVNELIKFSQNNKNTEIRKLQDDVIKIKNGSYIFTLIKEVLEIVEREDDYFNKVGYKLDKINKELNIEIDDNVFELLKRLVAWLFTDERLSSDVMSQECKSFKNKLTLLEQKILKLEKNDIKMKRLLKSKEIILEKESSSFDIRNVNFSDERLEMVNERIITIDSYNAISLDEAFSIKKERGYYIFDVYITDVPTFLRDNKSLARKAYEKGTSVSIKNDRGKRDTHIDILPAVLDTDYLSLRQNKLRSAIDFKFVIKNDGEIESVYVSRKKLRVTDKLNYRRLKELLFNQSVNSKVQWDILLYKEMVLKMVKKASVPYLREISGDRINDLMSFASVLVNYYVGEEADFAIYRNNGCYTKNKEENYYTHSATPLRRFVSNINLAFLLNQKREVSFSEKDLNYVESNIDEIIAHLNRQDQLSEFVNRNPEFAKRYVK